MRKKILIITILITFIALLFLNFYKVEATTEEGTDTKEEVATDEKSDKEKEVTAEEVDTEKETTTDEKSEDKTSTEVEWTDFSKAKFSLKREGNNRALIEISGVTPKEGSDYYLFITSSGAKPNVDGKVLDEGIELVYDEASKIFKTRDTFTVAKYVELNQDLYASVVERQFKSETIDNVISYGNKLTRFSEPKYSDAFFATHVTKDDDQIVMNFTHNRENNRKIQIKIGKISDTSILQKIKNKDTSGFKNLLSYAKSNSGIYNKTASADKDEYFIKYDDNSLINLKGLKDKEYYFLYVKTDSEGGKYISNEAVTLAQGSVTYVGWGLFFYGSSDFKWADWKTDKTTSKDKTSVADDEEEDDETESDKELPFTGTEIMAFIGLLGVISVTGIVTYKKYQKYNF